MFHIDVLLLSCGIILCEVVHIFGCSVTMLSFLNIICELDEAL